MGLLEGLLRYAELLSLSLWVGGIVFFSFIASPSIFGVLGIDDGGKVVRRIFPKYYGLGYGAGAAGTTAAVLLALLGAPGQQAMAVLLGVMTAIVLYMGRVLRPRILQVRAEVASLEAPDADPAVRARFHGLHRRSVLLNSVLLLLGLVTLFLFAWFG